MSNFNRWKTLFVVGPALVASVLISAVNPLSASAPAEGSLDNTFDTDGYVAPVFGGTGRGGPVGIQSDGKILVAGFYNTGSGNDFSVTRFNANGTLDTTFDTDGIVTTDLGGEDGAYSMVIQPDGRILVGGIADANGVSDFGLVRYNTDGSLDTSFDSDGIVTTNFGIDDVGQSLALQPDGKIIIGGWTNPMGWSDFALARYNTDGSLDTTFDTDGKITLDLGGDDNAYSVDVQSDGKILVAGYSSTNPTYDFALVRYNTDGTLDTTFDTDGIVTTDLGGEDGAYSMVIQPDGRILVGGARRIGANNDFALVRYNADGTLDTTFDTDGKNTLDLGGDDITYSVDVQSDGKILVAGYSSGSGSNDFALVRYNADGTLDTTFDTDGIVTSDFGGGDVGLSVALQPDGRILVGGYRTINNNSVPIVARYNSSTLEVVLTTPTATSATSAIEFILTGNGTINCSTLSITAGVDFNLTGITEITSISQTSPSVCTIAATSAAVTNGGTITSTLSTAPSFSIEFTNGNTRKSVTNAPQSISVTRTSPTTTAVANLPQLVTTPSTTIAPTTTNATKKKPTIRVRRLTKGSSIATYLGLKISKRSVLRLVVTSPSLKYCSVTSKSIRGKKVGTCRIIVKVTTQGKTKSKSLSLRVIK